MVTEVSTYVAQLESGTCPQHFCSDARSAPVHFVLIFI